MSTTTLTTDAQDLIAAGTSCVAGTPQRVAFTIDAAMGGIMTGKITNGATGPTAQCVARIYVAHTDGSTPAAAAEGADWKLFYTWGGGGTANNGVTRLPGFEIPHGIKHCMIEFAGNTVQNVTVECQLTEITGASTV